MKKVCFHLPEKYVEMMDSLKASGLYPSRGEIARVAIRDLLIREKAWGNVS